ncbi:MAG: ABC transporter permease [Gemmatimonas sp.]
MSKHRDDANLPMSGVKPVADDVRRELEFHLHERARELEASGMGAEQAMTEARAQFGDRKSVEEACEVIETRRRGTKRRAERFSALRQDVMVGLRVLRKSPGFTVAAITMLALGIGANSAVFSIVNRVLLQPLPYEHSNRLVTVVERHEKGGWGNLPWANFLDIKSQSRSFDAIAMYGSGDATVLGTSSPLRVRTGNVSSDFFKVLGTRPYKGRFPSEDEHKPGAVPVAVVSYAFWRDHLGSPASLDGVRIKVDENFNVIGVTPPGFEFPDGNQIWTPLEVSKPGMSRTSHNWETLALLKDGINPLTAQKDIDGVLARLAPQYAPDFDAVGSTVQTLQETLNGSFRTPLYLLLGASGLVLLAACVNLASAMLARGTARSGEFTVRFALGATRGRVVQQLVTESAMLAVAGCVAGLLLAAVILRLIGVLAPESLHIETIHVDYGVQIFALVVAVVTTLVFGLFPAFRLSAVNVSLALREGSRGTSGTKRMRVWNMLVATEVALAVVLLSSSALLVKSFGKVMQQKLGIDAESVMTARIDLPEVNYGGQSPTVAAFHERLFERLRTQPGISSVGMVNRLPLSGANPSGSLLVEGKPLDPRGAFNAYAVYRVVGGDYFAALGIPLLKGRTFHTGDRVEDAPTVIVDETFARSEWPKQDPLGKRVKVAGMDGGEEPWYTVIGVVGDVRPTSATGRFIATYYFDHRTRPPYRSRSVSYAIRSKIGAAAVAALLRREVTAIDAQVPVEIQSLSDIVSRSSSARRFPMLLIGAFALVALVMAIVGIYAVVSYAVTQRTREIGVRLALGATPVAVRSMVLGSAMRAVIPGLIVGAILSMASASLLRNMLYGVSPFDPTALVAGVALLAVAAFGSSLLPAIRATRVDPLLAMRTE